MRTLLSPESAFMLSAMVAYVVRMLEPLWAWLFFATSSIEDDLRISAQE